MPFIWGPIGGGQRTPPAFRQYFGRKWFLESTRNLWVRMLPYRPALRNAVRGSAAILVTNYETEQVLRNCGARNVGYFLDNGIAEELIATTLRPRSIGGAFTLLWVGRLIPRKALPLALDAVAKVNDLPVKLLIAGDGEMRSEWQHWAYEKLRLGNRVEFLGFVPWGQLIHLYKDADAFIFTSLRDSFGSQLLEAMAQGLPILALDHQGVHNFVPAAAAVRVPVTTPQETVDALASGIRMLVGSPELAAEMGVAGRTYSETQTWKQRALRMTQVYAEVVSQSRFDRP